MKKSDLVKMVLKESLSLCNEAQVLQNLAILEKAGMLPPYYLKEVENPLIPGDIPMGGGKFGTPVHEWEKE